MKHQISFVVGVFCGDGKPGSLDTNISHFVRELLATIGNGIKVETTVSKTEVKKMHARL